MTATDFDCVTVSDVTRRFGRRRALSGVSLVARSGRIVGVLGPNGAGKSTLIGLLATLIRPTSGEIRYGDGLPAEGGAAIRGRIGLLAHDLHLYLELTARENLEFFANLYGLPQAGPRAADALTRAGLAERADDRVAGFSRGMRQRLALERALLHDPRLVLLDEPFTGLDEAAARALVARLGEIRAGGAIVIVATHDLDLVDGLLDEAVLLVGGRLAPLAAGAGSLRARYRAQVGERGA